MQWENIISFWGVSASSSKWRKSGGGYLFFFVVAQGYLLLLLLKLFVVFEIICCWNYSLWLKIFVVILWVICYLNCCCYWCGYFLIGTRLSCCLKWFVIVGIEAFCWDGSYMLGIFVVIGMSSMAKVWPAKLFLRPFSLVGLKIFVKGTPKGPFLKYIFGTSCAFHKSAKKNQKTWTPLTPGMNLLSQEYKRLF